MQKTIAPEFINNIISEVIDPDYKNNIKYEMSWRSRYYKISGFLLISSKLFLYFSSIIAFIGASDIISLPNKSYFSFFAGCSVLLSELTLKFSDFSRNRSKKKTLEVNDLLHALGSSISIPDITKEDTIIKNTNILNTQNIANEVRLSLE